MSKVSVRIYLGIKEVIVDYLDICLSPGLDELLSTFTKTDLQTQLTL